MIVYHHLGLGDHIICNGLVRTLAEEQSVEVLCKNHNLPSVRFMFRDDSRISVIGVADDAEALALFKSSGSNKLKVGHENLPRFMSGGKQFDEAFYDQVGIPFSFRWSKFVCHRNQGSEVQLMDKLGIIWGERFSFLHDDPSRGFCINTNCVGSVVSPRKGWTDVIFDYLGVMESAAEIHCMDSCFKLTFDSMCNRDKGLFFHLNLNGRRKDITHSNSRLPWKVI